MPESNEEHYLKTELYELVRSDARIFEFLQAGSLDGIWYWDLEHDQHEWMSPRLWETFGYDPNSKQHLVSEWQDIIHPDDLELASRNFQAHCMDPNHPYDQVVRYRHRNGTTIWVRCRGVVIRDHRGKPIRMLGAHTDITELKQAEQALEAKTEELELSNRQLEQFAYAASHDLQEPARMVGSFMKLLEHECGEELNDRASKYMRFAMDGAMRMQQLIRDLLAIAHIQTEARTPRWVDVSQVVDSVIHTLEASGKLGPARVVRGPLPSVLADVGQLGQVFQNLVVNGIKFNRSDIPEVRVSAERLGTCWEFSVSDNGIGIEAEHTERVFEVFQRLHKRSEFDGSGIGLAIVRAIVARHGGNVSLDSTVGKGSTFRFTIGEADKKRGSCDDNDD